jgi:serine/threonine-protein kinase
MPDTDASQAPREGTIAADDATSIAGAYAMGAVIGSGGMGEVVAAFDRKVGRDVALKRMHGDAPSRDDVARFVREAQIQARLEHPAIVPVYELGRDPAGLPYFTMKRITGATLDQRLAAGVSQQRLLRAFVEVCRAIEFAHSRGVVHRDLKPANIALGEFGEVYVLDWGVARVVDDTDVAMPDDELMENAATHGSAVVGTPGYAAPEQVAGAPVGRAADVYALGSVLFEILAGERLQTRASTTAPSSGAATPVPPVDPSPASRRPERGVAPELDRLCAAMLARTPAQRPNARAVAERIDAYLDGDRDVAHRRQLATELVWQARRSLDDGHRDLAMRSASRALALDPQADGAGELLTQLMLDPGQAPPPAVAAAQQQADFADISHHARSAIPNYLVIAAFLPIVIANGARSWPTIGLTAVVVIALAAAAYRMMRDPGRSLWWMVGYAVLNSAMLALIGRFAGAMTFVPALVTFNTANIVTYPQFIRRPALLIAIMLAGFVAPFVLELAGVVQRTWEVLPDGIAFHGAAMDMSGLAAVITIVVASTMTAVFAGLHSSAIGRANRDARLRLVAQAWHLAQLLPISAPARNSSQPGPA